MTDDARFSDDEVGRLLSRAAELQGSPAHKTTSLAEIERIAREAGIDPALVRKAASELVPATAQAPGAAPLVPVDGSLAPHQAGPFGMARVAFELAFDGELSETERVAIEAALQEGLLSGPWRAEANGRALLLRRGGLRLSVAPRGGRTVVRVEQGLGGLMGGIWGGVGGGAGLPFAFLMLGFGVKVGGDVGALVGMFGGAVAAFAGTRALYVTLARAKEARAKEVITQAAAIVGAVLARQRGPAALDSALDEARGRAALLPAPLSAEVEVVQATEVESARRR